MMRRLWAPPCETKSRKPCAKRSSAGRANSALLRRGPDAGALGGGDTDWDTLTLGGFKLPGVPRVTVKRGRKLDKKSAKGRNGATITDGGGQGAEVEIELRIATAEDWDTWCLVLWALDPTKVAPQAYTVVHPQTEAFQVQSVMIEDISAGPQTAASTRSRSSARSGLRRRRLAPRTRPPPHHGVGTDERVGHGA